MAREIICEKCLCTIAKDEGHYYTTRRGWGYHSNIEDCILELGRAKKRMEFLHKEEDK